MKPIRQTRTGSDGNCLGAALCSILELPQSAIPELGDDDEWLDNLADWLEPRGLYYVQVPPNDPILKRMFAVGETWHLIEGISYRGGPHACVGLNGIISWDPHPLDGSRHGLAEVQHFGLLCSRQSK